MPLYDYDCRNCGHRVEVLHGVNGTGPQSCERCGGTMRKLMAAPTIVFKGSGWAKKDRSASASPAKKADSTASSTDTSSAEGASKDTPAAADASGSKSTAPATTAGTSSGPTD